MARKFTFNHIYFRNKWKEKHWGDFVLLGIQKWWCSPHEYCWKFAAFGFELSLWFKRKQTI